MQNSAFKTLTLIAKKNFKKLFLTFSLVLAENGLFLIYPVLAGIAINAIVAGDTLLALSYSGLVFVGWGLGSIRRRVDTQVFTRIYARLAVSVIMNEKSRKRRKRRNRKSKFISRIRGFFRAAFSRVFYLGRIDFRHGDHAFIYRILRWFDRFCPARGFWSFATQIHRQKRPLVSQAKQPARARSRTHKRRRRIHAKSPLRRTFKASYPHFKQRGNEFFYHRRECGGDF